MHAPSRKGATRVADVDPIVLQGLNTGTITAATLAENLATDMGMLLQTVLPELADKEQTIDPDTGITKRMAAVAALILDAYDVDKAEELRAHHSDLVRGWGAYMLGAAPDLALPDRMERLLPYADDPHFGVREWAWLAVRPHIVKAPEETISILTSWTDSPSEFVRRFAVEAIRPRGVWSAHIGVLKKEPALALPILESLRSDPSRYVQDSVSNWLNDAWKSSPDWVEALCSDWLKATVNLHTDYIVKRALRSKK